MLVGHLTPPPGARRWLIPLFLLHALPFLTRPALVGGDEPHYALMAHSIALDRDFDLRDDYGEVAAGSPAAGRKRAGQVLDPHLRPVEGKDLFIHPVGVPLLLAPLVWAQQTLAPGSAPDLPLVGCTLILTFGALLAGRRTLAAYLQDDRRATVWVFGAYFASPLWFYSRTLFTEPYTWSFAVLAVAALGAGRLAHASALLGLVVLTKESAVLLAVPILLGAGARLGWRRAAALLAGPAVAAALYGAKNVRLGFPVFTTSQPFQTGDVVAGAIGLLLDPRHGLLPFAPLLVLGAAAGAAATSARGATGRRLAPLLALGAFLAYLLVHAAWIEWRGGSCYGPRLLVPALPALAVVASHRAAGSAGMRRLLALAFVAGFTVAWCAALDPWNAFWGASPLALVGGNPLAAIAGALLAAATATKAASRWTTPPPG
jgi:hypothetical protein